MVRQGAVRSVYAAHDLEATTDRLDVFLDWADQGDVGELTRLASTVRHWRNRVLAYDQVEGRLRDQWQLDQRSNGLS